MIDATPLIDYAFFFAAISLLPLRHFHWMLNFAIS